MRYPVTLTPDGDQTVVTFPDVPGAITYGDTVEEALARAPDALLTVFDALIKDRRDIPAPSPTKGPAIALPALESAKLALYDTLRTARVSKAELGRRLDWHPTQVIGCWPSRTDRGSINSMPRFGPSANASSSRSRTPPRPRPRHGRCRRSRTNCGPSAPRVRRRSPRGWRP